MVYNHSGKPSFHGTGERVTSSVKTNCPFNIRISYHQDTKLWHLVIRNACHNHAPAPESTIIQHQQLEMRQKLPKINKQLASRVPNHKILQQLQREDPTSIIQSTDIQNHRHQELKWYLGGRTVLQALIQDFKNHKD
jgi:tRNA A37 threonylcarbamoyladenosine synthetase subunit TsaC/SUA5/YrdC